MTRKPNSLLKSFFGGVRWPGGTVRLCNLYPADRAVGPAVTCTTGAGPGPAGEVPGGMRYCFRRTDHGTSRAGGRGDWRSGSALRSHRRGHWFEPSIAHLERQPPPAKTPGRGLSSSQQPPHARRRLVALAPLFTPQLASQPRGPRRVAVQRQQLHLQRHAPGLGAVDHVLESSPRHRAARAGRRARPRPAGNPGASPAGWPIASTPSSPRPVVRRARHPAPRSEPPCPTSPSPFSTQAIVPSVR